MSSGRSGRGFGLGRLRKPRKGIAGYLWFTTAPGAERAAAIHDAVPEAFRACRAWAAPNALAIGTADDLAYWCKDAGSWSALREVLVAFVGQAATLHELAFVATSAPGVDLDAERQRVVVAVLRKHFADRAPRDSDEHDPGVWTLYYLLAHAKRGSTQDGGTDTAAFRGLVVASLGRCFDRDRDNLSAAGDATFDEGDDPRVALASPRSRTLDAALLSSLAERALEGHLVGAAWFARMVDLVLVPKAAPQPPGEAPLGAKPTAEAQAIYRVVERFRELGTPSAPLVKAALKVARAAGALAARPALLELYGSLIPVHQRWLVHDERAWLINDALASGVEAVAEREIANTVVAARARLATPRLPESGPTAALATVAIRWLLDRGRGAEAADVARDYLDSGSKVRATDETLAVVMRALLGADSRDDEDAFAAELARRYDTDERTAAAPPPGMAAHLASFANSPAHILAAVQAQFDRLMKPSGMPPLLLAGWHARRGRHAEAARLGARAIAWGRSPSELRGDPALATACTLEPLASLVTQAGSRSA